MSNNVDITMTADSKEVERALQRTEKELDKANMKLEQMKEKGNRATRETSGGFDRTRRSIGGAGAELASFVAKLGMAHFGVQQIGEEFEKMKRRQEAARLSTLAPAEARREAIFNFTPDKTVGYEGLDQRVRQISEQTRSREEVVWGALSAAFSAQGSQSNEVTLNAVRDALTVKPNDAGSAAILSGRGLDLAKYTGSTDIGANLGFLANLQSAVRLEDPTLVGTNIVPGIGAGRSYGDTAEQAGEVMAAFSQLLGDTRGDQSATAYQKMAGQLKNFVPKRDKQTGGLVGKDDFGKFAIPEEQFQAFQQAENTYQRMEALRKSPELLRGFIGSASFEVKSKEQTIELLRGEAKAMEELANAQSKIKPLDARQRRGFDEKIARMNAGDVQARLSLDQSVESAIQRGRLSDVEDQRIGAARDALNKALEESTPGLMLEKRTQYGFEMQMGLGSREPERAAAAALRSLKGNLAGSKAARVQAIIQELEASAESQQPLSDEREVVPIGGQRPPAAAVSPNAAFNSFRQRQAERNPQLDETNRLLKQIADQGERPASPRQTERRSSRLSRGSN